MSLTPFRSSRGFDLFGDRSLDRVFANPFSFRTMAHILNDLDREFVPQFDNVARLDISKSDTEYTVKVDTPGMVRDDIRIELNDGFLEISGETNQNSEVPSGEYVCRERYTGSFKRSVKLPDDADRDRVVAKYDNGVLVLNIPRLPEKENPNRRNIRIE